MNWNTALSEVMRSEEMVKVKERVKEDRKNFEVYPEAKDMFRAFDLCPLEKTRIVIFGQDPYHTPGTADGLAFSTQQDKRPPSLNVIFKEAYRDLQIKIEKNVSIEEYFPTNNLESWTSLGFLLLNTALTVKQGEAGSHSDIGWNKLVHEVISILNKHAQRRIIFLLWGTKAQELAPLIEQGNKHLYFTAPHPAAEMYGNDRKFTGCGHFSLVMNIIATWISKKDPDYEFNIEELKNIIAEIYPDQKDRVLGYMDKGWIFSNTVNREKYLLNCSKFESLISTKK